MKLLIAFIFFTNICMGQIGIDTPDPQATLHVFNKSLGTSSPFTGIAFPQVNTLAPNGAREGQVVFLTTNSKYYFWDGTNWKVLDNTSGSVFIAGDIKQSIATADHGNWILLNGRSTTDATLTASQMTTATALFGSNLPNAAGKVLKMSTAVALGQTSGSNTRVLTQSNLPLVTYSGVVTQLGGAHTHTFTDIYGIAETTATNPGGATTYRGVGSFPGNTTDPSGNHSHSGFTVSSDGSNTPFNVEDNYLITNSFVYLP